MKRLSIYLILIFLPAIAVSQNIEKEKGKYYDQSGNLFTGKLEKYYDQNEQLKAKFNIEKGVLDGRSMVYFKDGSKKEVRAYKDGKMHGVWKTWNKEGVKIARAVYENGKKDGSWKIWDDKGTLRFKMFYENGQKTGTWYNYNEEGKLVATRNFEKN